MSSDVCAEWGFKTELGLGHANAENAVAIIYIGFVFGTTQVFYGLSYFVVSGF